MANAIDMMGRFPRSSKYNPAWVMAGLSGAAHPLWMAEWLCEAIELKPGMRVLDLGCGRASSSIFLQHEFGVEVWATDLWFSASQNLQRVRDAEAVGRVFPIYANARALPFAEDFFDAIISIDSFVYYGTDDLYLNYLVRFLRKNGLLAIAGAGLTREMEGIVPEHLSKWWTSDLNCLHSAEWWSRHWSRSGLVDVTLSDAMPDGWQAWLEWHRIIAPDNHPEIEAIEKDAGRTIGYVRTIARLREGVELGDVTEKVSCEYKKEPLFLG